MCKTCTKELRQRTYTSIFGEKNYTPTGFAPKTPLATGIPRRYFKRMDPIINLEDTPGKVVGRRKPPADPLDPLTHRKDDARTWHETFRTGGLPKGVYRFHSHEEADEWLWKMLTRKKRTSYPADPY